MFIFYFRGCGDGLKPNYQGESNPFANAASDQDGRKKSQQHLQPIKVMNNAKKSKLRTVNHQGTHDSRLWRQADACMIFICRI